MIMNDEEQNTMQEHELDMFQAIMEATIIYKENIFKFASERGIKPDELFDFYMGIAHNHDELIEIFEDIRYDFQSALVIAIKEAIK